MEDLLYEAYKLAHERNHQIDFSISSAMFETAASLITYLNDADPVNQLQPEYQSCSSGVNGDVTPLLMIPGSLSIQMSSVFTYIDSRAPADAQND